MRASPTRSAAILTGAVIGSNLGQAAWLVGGSRALTEGHFGTVLAAQALYGFLQIIADNGTSFLGARRSARSDLESEYRREVVRVRLLLATLCAVTGVGIAAIGGISLLRAFAPFAAALMLFSVLNVWERYGRGDVVPFAGYLLLRSLIVGTLAAITALVGARFPLEAAGVCELAAIALVGFGFSAWTLPRGALRVRASIWRSARDIGLPAVLTQYNFAVGTIALGVTGRTSEAAISGVAMRLLTGLQGLNGAVAASVFPRLARAPTPEARDARAGRLAAAGGVVLAAAALLVVAVLAEPLAQVFMNRTGDVEEASLILATSAAGLTGLVMHSSFALVASDKERLLRRATASGASVVTAGSVAATFIEGSQSALAVIVAFMLGQIVTLSVIGSPAATGKRALTVVAAVVLPGLGVLIALFEEMRVLIVGVGGAAMMIWAAVHHRRFKTRLRRAAAARNEV